MFCGDRENSRTSGPGYVSASHPLPFASCRFSFQIVPFLTGAVVFFFFFRRDESHMARDKKKKKRNRSICDLQNSSCRCCYFLSSSRCRLSRLKKTGSNFTPAPNFFFFFSIMRGRSRKNKRPILIALYSYLLFKFFVLLWLPVCGNSTSGQKCVLLFWGGFRVPQHQNGF